MAAFRTRHLAPPSRRTHGTQATSLFIGARRKNSSSFLIPRLWQRTLVVGALLAFPLWLTFHFESTSATPLLSLHSPLPHLTVHTPSVTVEGMTDPLGALTLNGSPLLVEKSGHFITTVPLTEGATALHVVVTRLGHETTLERTVIYTP